MKQLLKPLQNKSRSLRRKSSILMRDTKMKSTSKKNWSVNYNKRPRKPIILKYNLSKDFKNYKKKKTNSRKPFWILKLNFRINKEVTWMPKNWSKNSKVRYYFYKLIWRAFKNNWKIVTMLPRSKVQNIKIRLTTLRVKTPNLKNKSKNKRKLMNKNWAKEYQNRRLLGKVWMLSSTSADLILTTLKMPTSTSLPKMQFKLKLSKIILNSQQQLHLQLRNEMSLMNS